MTFFTVDKKWIESLPCITNFKHMSSKRYTPDGILSEQIFGPVKDYTCWCKAYNPEHIMQLLQDYKQIDPGFKTPFCYYKRNRKMEWHENPPIKEYIKELDSVFYFDGAQLRCYRCNVPITSSTMRAQQFARIKLPTPILNPLMELLLPQLRYVVNGSKRLVLDNDKLIITKNDTGELQDHIELAEYIHTVYDNVSLDFILLENVLVFPAAFREPYEWNIGEVNRRYNQIIAAAQTLPIATVQQQRSLYQNVKAIYEWIYDRVGADKEKGVRSYLLGRELANSARSAILPDPTLDVTTISIPQTVKKYWPGFREKDRVIVNRQPTLHRRSMLCVFSKFNEDPDDNVIYFNPFIYEGMNADNDGDSAFCLLNIYYNNKKLTVHIKDLKYLDTNDFLR